MLIARGIDVVIVGHSTVKRYQPPLAETGFDRYQLKLYEANSNRLMEWADAVLFLDWDTLVAESRNGKPRGIGGRTRAIYTQHSAGWDAKIRINLPEKLPCQFDAVSPLLGQQQEEVRNEAPGASASPSEAQDTAPSPSYQCRSARRIAYCHWRHGERARMPLLGRAQAHSVWRIHRGPQRKSGALDCRQRGRVPGPSGEIR